MRYHIREENVQGQIIGDVLFRSSFITRRGRSVHGLRIRETRPLTKCYLNTIDGDLEAREYVYYDRVTGTLPNTFDDGSRVPKRFHAEVEKYFRKSENNS